MGGGSDCLEGVLEDEPEGFPFGVFPEVGAVGRNAREEDGVDVFGECPLLSVGAREDNFLQELALDPGDAHTALGVVGFADHDALITRQIVVFYIRVKLLSK
jgi:hypothetical protein